MALAFALESPQSDAMQSMFALDTNHDNLIDPKEIAAFAKIQGQTSDDVMKDFATFDTNHDGLLDVQEVSLAFGATADESQPEDVAKDHKTELRQSAPLPESVQMVETSSFPPKPLQTESAVPVKANATLAQMAAEFLSSGLAGQAHEDSEAANLDEKARALRADADAAVKALDAHAPHVEVQMERVTQLEASAEDAEVKAAVGKARSRALRRRALDFVGITQQLLSADD